ncbi:MAG TPA: hypothetical protein VLF71_00635 [Candidatus Saccharimonadales bacterium]|nr:hypothetical protein [Candidatus Saccharimonadales bacterium]
MDGSNGYILLSPNNQNPSRFQGKFSAKQANARNMELVSGLATRLGEMACGGHDHMANMAEAVNDGFGLGRDGNHDDQGYVAAHEAKDSEDEKARAATKRNEEREVVAGSCG